jgi:DNA-binding response OmpR family regulator
MSPETILIIEDDEEDVILLDHSLKMAGLKNPIEVASDGDAALKFLLRRIEVAENEGIVILPLFVLLDLKLPKLNGFEILERIRKIPALAKLVIIVLTASDTDSDVLLAYELGARSYLVKPPSSADLLTVVRTVSAMPSPEWLQPNQLPGLKVALRNSNLS